MVKFALSLGPADYFALMVLAFVTVSAAFGDSALRGLTALCLGLTLGLVGIDLQTGQARLDLRHPRPARRHRGDDARGGALRRSARR